MIAILLAAAVAQAQPLPTALLAARTVYVVNAGVHAKAIGHVIATIQSAKRWTIVANAQDADITLTVSAQPTKQMYNWAIGTTMTANSSFLAITGKDGTALYGTVFTGWPDKELKKLMTRLTTASEQP